MAGNTAIVNALSETDIIRIKSDLLEILSEQCEKWSRGESSSVPVEKAQEIMNSIMYVITIKLKSCQSPEHTVEMLKSNHLKWIFESGLKIVQRKTAVARHLQKRIINNLLETPNVYYSSTIVDGINGFFRLYRPQLAAHEIHITADYPVFAGRPQSEGIEFIEEYLSCIEAENAFCVQFHPQDIHHLLCGLTEDYRSIPMNIFEYVMLSALGLVLQNKNPKGLNLTREDVENLYSIFYSKKDHEVLECLENVEISLEQYGLLPKSTKEYLSVTLEKLASSIVNGAKTGTLDKLFLVPVFLEQKVKLSFDFGEPMDNRKYQELVEKIMYAGSREDIISLILDEVHSFVDLLDIMSDAELYEEDFELLVSMMPLSVFAFLVSRFPNDDFLVRESDKLLFKALEGRRKQFSTIEEEQLQKMLDTIQ